MIYIVNAMWYAFFLQKYKYSRYKKDIFALKIFVLLQLFFEILMNIINNINI